MFGYLSVQKRNMTWQMSRCYQNYYCRTCFGLEQNYEQSSRFLLSYVEIIGIMLKETAEEKILLYLLAEDIPMATVRVLSEQHQVRTKIASIWGR